MSNLIPVKFLHSGMTGAPKLNSGAGDAIAVLDAALLNGFNLSSLDSLTYDSGAGTITGTVSAGHGFELHQAVLIAGATETGFNGEFRITSMDTTTFTCPITADPGAATATGTSTCKTAPVAGWEKAFDDGAGTKAAYRSTEPAATGCLLRVDDTNTAAGWNTNGAHAEITGYETMSDVDNGSGGFYDNALTDVNDYKWIRKSNITTSEDREWEIIGDSLLFYINVDPYLSLNRTHSTYCFGDINTVRPGDAFHCILIAGGNNTSSSDGNSGFGDAALTAGKVLARNYAQMPNAVLANNSTTDLSASYGYGGFPVPNPADNSIYFDTDIRVVEVANNSVRGFMPGLLNPLHQRPYNHKTITETLNSAARLTLFVLTGAVMAADTDVEMGMIGFDITGPWR